MIKLAAIFLTGAALAQSPPLPPGFVAPKNTAVPPALTISTVTVTNNVASALGWSTVVVVYDRMLNQVTFPAGGGQGNAPMICSNTPALAITIQAAAGTVNELEFSDDLKTWSPSNVRWVSDGTPTVFYVTAPTFSAYYRLRKQ